MTLLIRDLGLERAPAMAVVHVVSEVVFASIDERYHEEGEDKEEDNLP